MKNFASIFLSLLCFVSPAWADSAEPIVFSRSNITILPEAPQKEEKKDEADKDKKEAASIVPARQGKRFNVTIKAATTLDDQGVFLQEKITDDSGVMYVLEPAAPAAIQPANLLTPVDVVVIANDGVIIQIAPSINLSELAAPIEAAEPVRAFLHLKAGTCAVKDIQPRDRVSHDLFTKAPTVLQ